MEKSALIIDTPKKCDNCPLFEEKGWDDGYVFGFCNGKFCTNKNNELSWINDADIIPEWCPLIPINKITQHSIKINRGVH